MIANVSLIVAFIVGSYLVGSIPAAYIVTRMTSGEDIRAVGSGNPGATNVYRSLGAKYAIPVFAFDFLKGFSPVALAMRGGFSFAVSPEYIALAAGSAAILGHLFPVFLGGKGGKGVATGAGVVSALFSPLIPACLAVFLAVLLFTRRMSLASICAAASVPPWYAAIVLVAGRPFDWVLFAFLSLASGVVLARHWRNMRRLRAGTERPLF